MVNPSIISVHQNYAAMLLKHKGIAAQPVGNIYNLHGITVNNIFTAEGYHDHNRLIDINRVFSNNPGYSLIDRTETVVHPLKYHVPRPWKVPTRPWTLNQALQHRVEEFEQTGQKINVFWSGGIDSTVATTAFLKHLRDPSQLRVIYSPWSTYEHPEYLDFLAKWPSVEKIDMSGNSYLQLDLDGLLVTGDSGDEIHASIDRSFLDKYGYDTLFSSWKDFFHNANPDSEFIEFCEKYFALSGKNISTVLEARWWFYLSCKLHGHLHETKLPFFIASDPGFDATRLHGFFDSFEYESYVYFNIDQLMPTSDYSSWRQMLKDYCFEFDKLETWHKTHKKITSAQMVIYSFKKTALLDKRWILLLQDGTRISTPSLPLFSKREFDQTYGSSLDYVFRAPQ